MTRMLRKVLGSGGDGGKRKTVRAEDGGEVRRRLREREAGREGAYQKGRMREVRMSRAFANGEQGDADRQRI